MSKFSSTAKELKKWSNLLLKIRPTKSFSALAIPTEPDYSDKDTWLAHPTKPSKALMRPTQLEEKILDEVPTFFIHPTTYFGSESWNADIQHTVSREMIEEMVLPGQASVFNHLGPIYAPIYRQATFYSFMVSNQDAYSALDLAYEDIKRAFIYFLKEIGDRPFFVAGHSQGSLLGMRLLAEEIETKVDVRKQLVAAYLPGYKLPLKKFDKEFDFIKKGKKPDQVHCVLAWDTFIEGFNPLQHIDNASTYIVEEGQGKWKRRMMYTPFCINPITWDVDKPSAMKAEHRGAVVNEYDRAHARWVDVGGGEVTSFTTKSLSVPKPELVSTNVGLGNLLQISKPAGLIYNIGKMPGGNYHVYDYTLFYMDIRHNASLRWKSYKSLYLD